MKEYLIKILFGSFPILLLQFCTSMNEPAPMVKYSLLFNLSIKNQFQEVYIYKTLFVNENISSGIFQGYSPFYCDKANITLTTNNYSNNNFTFFRDTLKQKVPFDTTKFYAASIKYYYRNNNPLNVIPNKKYEISVNIDDVLITGETIVPCNFKIKSPVENQIFRYNNDNLLIIPINWSKSDNALCYSIDGYFSNNVNSIFPNEFSYTLTDTTYTYIRHIDDAPDRKGKFIFVIFAFDKNYYNHVIKKKPSAGIQGAYGYFGSSVVKSVTVNIQ